LKNYIDQICKITSDLGLVLFYICVKLTMKNQRMFETYA